MAGQARHLKVKGGRFYARLAVPARLRQIIGKTELVVPLGGERRAAMKALPAAVATLQRQIDAAEGKTNVNRLDDPRSPITTQDYGRAVWARYQAMLEADDATRAAHPSPRTISDEQARLLAHMNSGAVPADPLAVLDASLDLMRLHSIREIDQSARQVKLDALRGDLAKGRTHLVEHEVEAFLSRNNLTAPEGSAERAVLAKQIIRAEIEALERTLECDRDDYGGKPADPAVKPPAATIDTLVPVNLAKLLEAYVTARTQAGSMKDGGKRSRPVIENLRKFLSHSDARRVTRKDLLEWRKHLMGPCKLSGKTVDSIYLSLVRSLWSWAVDNEILPENVAATVRQARPKRQRTREAGYTDAEAVAVLKATIHYQPKQDSNGRIHEAPKLTRAKRWLPILCAFTGARVAEMTQLRKEDVRQEGDRWVIRVTPGRGNGEGWRLSRRAAAPAGDRPRVYHFRGSREARPPIP